VPNAAFLFSRFDVAFGLMSIIPLLICTYLITVKFFSISILAGMNGVYLLLAVIFALLGLLIGRELIQDVIRRLIDANAKLARLYNMQAAFVSNVAHEFRSPLAIFKGVLDNLADGLYGPLSADQAEPIAACQKEVNRLTRLVSDLLDVAQMEAGKLRLRQEDVLLQDTLQSVAKFFDPLIKERNLQLELELPATPAHVVGDRDRLRQVFINLLSNAIKYTDRGRIRLRLTPADGAIQVVVEDTGRGIAANDLERIFDKFERIGAQNEPGSGLGLPIARDIITLHQGRLWAESQPGQGSRFIVQLPVS
jgi:signal transduction histidine kinase